MKILVAATLINQFHPVTGQILVAHKAFVQYLIDGLRQEGHDVFCSIETDGWQLNEKPSEVGLLRDLDGIRSCQSMVVLASDEAAIVTQFEIGYAVALDKRVILAQNESVQSSWFNQAMVGAGMTTFVQYTNPATLLDQLSVALTV